MIDDNEVLCGAVSIALRTQGFGVIEAHDGRSGVDLFRVHEAAIDVIVMDLTLPLLSGREALRQLKQIRPRVKVILTTSFSKDSALRALGGLHPWEFLQKRPTCQANSSTCCRRHAKLPVSNRIAIRWILSQRR